MTQLCQCGKCADRDPTREDRPFPIQATLSSSAWGKRPACSIPWWLAEVAYVVYAKRYGTSQSLERLAQRGGFGRGELVELLQEAVL